ncbi:MAG: hypothetical protein EON85_15740 [Brevundimonas sp.]|nr:MAG: hypothetical protein EON85_15740 [Brevundimonas sp.]
MIGVDWGSSNLRVFRMGEGGTVLDRRADGRGATTLASGQQICFMGDKAVKLILDSANIPTQKRFEET